MLSDNKRICDVCGVGIPPGEKFKKATVSAENAARFLDVNDPELIPTFIQHQNGQIQIDICQECVLRMGDKGNIT